MIGGIIIYFTQLYWIDPVFSLIIVIVILSSTWSLLKESLALTLDAVPKDISIEEIKKNAEDLDGIKNLHHIHIWAMSTTENAMTAHMVIEHCDNINGIKEIKNKLKHRLEHMNIQHITLETEFSNDDCLKKECTK
jgi:cobalt-zinc-cadmium efflux system protein